MFDLKCFGRSLVNVKWILECLKRVVSYENWRSSVLIDNAEYSFGLMEFLMLIYFNLVVPKRVEFCENES